MIKNFSKKLSKLITTTMLSAYSLANAAQALAQGAPTSTSDPRTLRDALQNPENSGGITNPAINPALGTDTAAAASGSILQTYIIYIWRSFLSIVALLLIFYLLRAAVSWMTAGGEKGKVEEARNQITNAIIGFIILLGSFAIINFISELIGFDLLSLTFPAIV